MLLLTVCTCLYLYTLDASWETSVLQVLGCVLAMPIVSSIHYACLGIPQCTSPQPATAAANLQTSKYRLQEFPSPSLSFLDRGSCNSFLRKRSTVDLIMRGVDISINTCLNKRLCSEKPSCSTGFSACRLPPAAKREIRSEKQQKAGAACVLNCSDNRALTFRCFMRTHPELTWVPSHGDL